MEPTILHKTIKIKKLIKAPPAKVFKALSSAKQKAEWSAPGDDVLKYLKANFKVGGEEIFKCGSPGDLNFKGVVRYEDIVKNERMIYTETVYYKKKKLATALITTELLKKNQNTLITMVIQLVSFSGEKIIKGNEAGYKGSLESLNNYLN